VAHLLVDLELLKASIAGSYYQPILMVLPWQLSLAEPRTTKGLSPGCVLRRDAGFRRSLPPELDTPPPARGLSPCATLTLPWFVSSWRCHEELHIPCQPEAIRNKSTRRLPGAALVKFDG